MWLTGAEFCNYYFILNCSPVYVVYHDVFIFLDMFHISTLIWFLVKCVESCYIVDGVALNAVEIVR